METVIDDETGAESYNFPEHSDTVDAKNIIGARKLEDGSYSILHFDEKSDPKVQKIHVASLPDIFLKLYAVRLSNDTLPPHSTSAGNEKVPNTHVVVSTLSGTGLAPDFYQNILKIVLNELGLWEERDYVLHYTKSALTITEATTSTFLARANQGIEQRIILLSGDGGVADILAATFSAPHTERYKEPVISILPMGTGNALANSSGINKDGTKGLSTLVRGVEKPIPLFKATFSPGSRLLEDGGTKENPAWDNTNENILHGAVVASWGLHAGLVADSDTPEYRQHGLKRFAMAVNEALYPADGSPAHRYKAHVSLLKQNDEKVEEWKEIPRTEHAYILATLVSNLEEKFVISPASKPLDGRLRIVEFGHVPGEEFLRLMSLAYQGGKHVDETDVVGYQDIEGLRIEFKGMEDEGKWRRICIDGKIVRVDKEGWVEIKKETTNVLKLTLLK